MYRNIIQLNTVTKERTNEEGLMNHKRKKRKEKRERKKKVDGKKYKAVETSRPACNWVSRRKDFFLSMWIEGRKESTGSSLSVSSLDSDVVLMTESDSPGPEAQIETNDTLWRDALDGDRQWIMMQRQPNYDQFLKQSWTKPNKQTKNK